MSLISEIKNWIKRHQIYTQLPRFLIIGGISTIISYSAFLICLHPFKIHYILASMIGFIAGIAFSYPCNARWTFKSQYSTKRINHYLAVYLCSLLISLIFLKITVDFIGIAPEIAYIICIIITTVINFLGTKFFVFKA